MSKKRRSRLEGSGWWPPPKRRRPPTTFHITCLLALSWFQLAHAHYYASLPRFGQLSGLLLRDEFGQQQQQPEVVAFLGLPYAAAPVGPLRFMPPGGLNSAAVAAMAGAPETRTLEYSGRRAQVRALRTFGRRCPHLTDWLPDAARPPPEDQSEECLNANLFVPLPLQPSSNQQESRDNLREKGSNEKATKAMSRQPEVPAANRQERSNSSNNNEPLDQDTPLRPLPLQRRLPVLVLIHTAPAHGNHLQLSANSLAHAKTAATTGALVVTFNFRQGLLGFLPFADDGNHATPRNNHAIWDQLGLLHWLRHNAAHFGADPQSVTILPADNHALQLAQLLALSPQAKGLFKRAMLVYDERRPGPGPANLSDLWHSPGAARDLRRRLAALLVSAAAEVGAPEAARSTGALADFIRAANLSQLALLERRLSQTASDQLLALMTGPTLDDSQLFGSHLAQVRELADFTSGAPAISGASNLTLQRAELDYCLYMRQLYADGPDPIGLLARKQPDRVGGARLRPSGDSGWRHELNYTNPKARARRLHIASTFNHLQRVHLLNHLLQLHPAGHSPSDTSSLDEPQPPLLDIQHGSGSLGDKPQSSFDLMLGYLQRPSADTANAQSGGVSNQPFHHKIIYPNMVKHLINRTGATSANLSEHLLALLKLADLQFVSSWTEQPEVLAHTCDFASAIKSGASNFTWPMLRSTFVFVTSFDAAPSASSQSQISTATSQHVDSENSDWFSQFLSDTHNVQELNNFISSGDPNGYHTQGSGKTRWFPYTTQNRHIRRAPEPEDRLASVQRDRILLHMDALPYLSLLSSSSTSSSAAARNTSSGGGDRLSELATCFGEIELALARFPSNEQHLNTPDEVKCLANSVATYRAQLRQFAADDLDRLVRWTRQQQQVDAPHSLSSVSITTRNLVSDESATNETHLESSYLETSEANNTVVIVRNATAPTSAHLSPAIQTFLNKAYNGAAGRPLLMLVGGGLSILLINLLIVAVIALRAARARRQSRLRSEADPSQDATAGSLPVDSCKGGKPDGVSACHQEVQLTSSLKRTSRSSSRIRRKQLKFDLTGAGIGEPPATTFSDENMSNCSFVSPHVDLSAISLMSQHQMAVNNQQQEELMYNNFQTEPILLSATPLLSNDQFTQIMHQVLPTGYSENEPINWANNGESAINLNLGTRPDFCAGISSQILNQSQSSSLSTTANNNSNNQHNHHHHLYHRQHLDGQAQVNQQLQVNSQPFGHCNHSVASPGSSTTVSLTPIQLESAAMTSSHTGGFSPQYQLKPIGLLYQSDQADEGGEKAMYLVENAPPADLDLTFNGSLVEHCYQAQ